MTTTTTTTRTGTYQMLWDCPVCGTRKLLGVDHRHCPNCGAPQEENLRYFPSPEDRVATEFRGSDPDWECEHCGTPTGSNAGFCAGCGAPRGDSTTVHVRASIDATGRETGEQAASEWKQRQAEARAELAVPEPPRTWQSWVRKALRGAARHPTRTFGVGLFVAVFALLLFVMCDREVPLRVTGHSWQRTIPVEEYRTVQESDWCSSTPGDARIHSRRSEIHHYDQVPDGEDCRSVPGSCSQSCSNIDNGNGSFSEVCSETCSSDRTECTTRYRSVPVYADKCSYEVDRWISIRSAEASGVDRSPNWPAEPAFSGCPTVRLGCERIGARYGSYRVHYVTELGEDERESFECEFGESRWAGVEAGSQWIGQVSRIGGKLDCEELLPADE